MPLESSGTFEGQRAPLEPSSEYAPFIMRLAAVLIDGVLLNIFTSILGFIIGFVIGFVAIYQGITEIAGLDIPIVGGIAGGTLGFLITVLYDAILTCSNWHGTLGKKILNLEVTTLDGQYLSFGRSLLRAFLKIFFSCATLYIGLIIAAFTEKKQALHDMLAGTVVVNRK